MHLNHATDLAFDALVTHLAPAGAIVMVEAEHMCLRIRGAGKCNSRTFTLSARGIYRDDPAQRAEALQLLNIGRSQYELVI